ncbi:MULTISPECIES: HAD family hydrolase [unclassified Coleofasciculus]|uniref:HAD family hydrolase n=1 Tax=unclassified Coleofasciculus TaxID=2692782 RepID=UPI00187FE6F2|nr:MULTISPECIES: HAD family hydrolase [unclassified Coleofasciculus]MBE9125286.1 HAD family hydrolase [Coleofasciculus sp. LEGE 07081]MBE9147067.1 HAD family hydrolase [Coleofasciculus sp. LEGE 07092]
MLKAVIFDVDGTLVDSVDLHAQAWQVAFKHFGYDFPYDKLRHKIGMGSDQLIPDFISQEEFERFGDSIADYRKEYYQENLLSQVRPFDKVPELFERLKADGKKIVLASSSRKKTLEHYKELLNINSLADDATSGDDSEKSKPEPDIFQAALDKLDGITAEDAIVVGDSPYDAIAAGKINLRTIGVLCGGFSEAELKEAGCIVVYRDPADLLDNYEQSLLGQS